MAKGIGVSQGVGIGRVLKYTTQEITVPAHPAQCPEEEIQRFRAACQAVAGQNEVFRARAMERAGGQEAAIFDAHLMLLDDEDSVSGPIEALIRERGMNAAAAAAAQFDEIYAGVSAVEDEHLRQRAADILDLKGQLLRELLQVERVDVEALPEGTVLLARELAPSDTIRMDVDHIAGIVCEGGGPTSHAAILAKAMGIPAVVGCAGVLDEAENGAPIALDGGEGLVVCSPGPEELARFQVKARELEGRRAALDVFRGRPSVTGDGRRVELCANIAQAGECAAAVELDCEGVGLFRSECLYMGRTAPPSEEEQFACYREALLAAGGRPVTIRTLDAGGDKEIPYLTDAHEENPFLGYRAIRICLDQPRLFHTQLRALYRASAYGRLRIMFPMVSSLDELRQAKEAARRAREELAAGGAAMGGVELGVMIEVPSAALLADTLAREADFFSIGTNDLTQYTLAADRGNKRIAHLYSHFHPAVIALIARAIEAAHRHGIPCGMCGEAASDPEFIPLLVGLGLDEFSMSAHSILPSRQLISQLSYGQWRELSRQALAASSAQEVRGLLAAHH